jgi:hypothetical protein
MEKERVKRKTCPSLYRDNPEGHVNHFHSHLIGQNLTAISNCKRGLERVYSLMTFVIYLKIGRLYLMWKKGN